MRLVASTQVSGLKVLLFLRSPSSIACGIAFTPGHWGRADALSVTNDLNKKPGTPPVSSKFISSHKKTDDSYTQYIRLTSYKSMGYGQGKGIHILSLVKGIPQKFHRVKRWGYKDGDYYPANWFCGEMSYYRI